ncbi:sensor histidine kinase [Saccharopolyspora phatthalungensis]|uniref:histidine kinase n=1 Tax=Saccharopolyspora phatthalungensis TaxID=664693 RepID=A0A840Q140_9PSEU|nr:HAMP domain-containing sensor histidine kinase [Saccharopolyspora phatthalungensis]MBB5153251.1 signal transduction histidine kinase [Saccharopolyspora phatthalungensis]
MRRRLLLVLLTFSVLAVAGFAAPLLRATAAERTQQLVLARTADLDRFAALADHAFATGDTTQLIIETGRYTELYGEPLVVVDANRAPVVETGGMRAAEVADLIDKALRNELAGPVPWLRPWSEVELIRYRPVGDGTRVTGAVVLRASVQHATQDITGRWALIAAGALSALVVCGLLAWVLARWVLRPLADLRAGVRAVGAGSRRSQVPVDAGPPELRELAVSFNRMSEAVADADEQRRRLVADASHQLRNPMAALRLRVDALERRITPEGTNTYRSALDEVARLESLLDRLLALATADRGPESTVEPSEIDAVASDRIQAWRAAAEAAGIRFADTRLDQAETDIPAHDLAQILDILLDNAIKYAGRGTTVTVRCEAGPRSCALTVSDTGSGLSDAEISLAAQRFWRAGRHRGSRGSGLGLAIADRLVSARGGSLRIEPVRPHGLSVRVELPVRGDA